MIDQSDHQARLRLLRYGMLIVVIMTFVVTLTYPIIALQDNGLIGDFLGTAILYSAVVAVLCVLIYVGYSYLLTREIPKPSDISLMGSKKEDEEAATE